MTDLLKQIKSRITREGPLSIADYMSAALLDPVHGYYAKQDPFGTNGDFITAPEISQMFGELIGLWAAEVWMQMGAPAPVNLVELGPGRGTLQQDVQRAISKALPEFWEAAQVHMVEASPALTSRQKEALKDRTHNPVVWVKTLEDVPDGPTLLIANEFFDALPVRQFEFDGTKWRERCIGHGPEDDLTFVLGPEASPRHLPEELAAQAAAGDLWEECSAAHDITREIAVRLTRHKGAALLIDYGHETSGFGETLQALRKHAFADVLLSPGDADLTTHVDFAGLARTARGAGIAAAKLKTQGDFLMSLGITARAQTLKANAHEMARKIDLAVDRLIAADQMGRLFKVLALHSNSVPTPPGFVAE